MSEKQEHRKRLNARLQYAAEFERWVAACPSVLTFWKIKKWIRAMPKREVNS